MGGLLDRAFALQTMQCGTCGALHAISRVMRTTAKCEGGSWHCLAGYARSNQKGTKASELDRVRAELEAARERMAALARVNDVERNRTLTILHHERRRAAAGTCCKRTFRQLARHMATRHPDHGQSATCAESVVRIKRRNAAEVDREQV